MSLHAFKQGLLLHLGMIALLMFTAGCDQAQQQQAKNDLPPLVLSASVDRAKPTTGDTITYRVLVDRDERFDFDLPEFGADIAGLRIVDFGVDEQGAFAGRVKQSYWYKLRADLSNVYVLPPIHLKYKRPAWYMGTAGVQTQDAATDVKPIVIQGDGVTDEAGASQDILETRTSQIFIEVRSQLDDGSSMQLRDIKPLPELPYSFMWVYILLGAVLLIAIIVIVLVVLRKRDDALVPIPAHELAYAALARLAGGIPSEQAVMRLYYYQLSSILREYLEQRFEIYATDMTSEELIPQLFHISSIDELHRIRLTALLREFDEVKYAGQTVTGEQCNSHLQEVKRFVDDTRELSAEFDEEEDE